MIVRMSVDQRFDGNFVLMAYLTVAFMLSATDGAVEKVLSLLPYDPTGLVGEELHLWCAVSRPSNCKPSDLEFKYSFANTGKKHSFNTTFVKILNETTAQLTLHNLTDNLHFAKIFCFINCNNFTFSDYQILKVGRHPAIPVPSCHRFFNWQEFILFWKIKPKRNGFETTYTAWFKSSLEHDDFRPCQGMSCNEGNKDECPYQVNNTCHIPEKLLWNVWVDGWLTVKVNATNRVGSSTSSTIRCFVTDYVEPGPVKELDITDENGSDVVRFRPPVENKSLTFQILISSLEDQMDTREKFFQDYSWKAEKRELRLKYLNLTPFTRYKFSIRSKVTKLSVEENQTDIWSIWTNTTFLSNVEEPVANPDVCRNCFEITSVSKTIRAATIYFKPLTKDQARGNVSYHIICESSLQKRSTERLGEEARGKWNRTIVLGQSSSFPLRRLKDSEHATLTTIKDDELIGILRMNLSTEVEYKVMIYAENKAGKSEITEKALHIPTYVKTPLPPANCSVVSLDDRRVLVRWNNTPETDGIPLQNFTVVWCQGTLSKLKCQESLNWVELKPEKSSLEINLMRSHDEYLFGIAKTTGNSFSSGIHWTCLFFERLAVASPPRIFPLNIDSNEIVLQLEKPAYSWKEGLTYGYNFYYRPIQSGEDKGKEEPMSKMYVDDRLTRGVVTVDGLKWGTSYEFLAESLTTAGSSYRNSSVILITKPFQLTDQELGWIFFFASLAGIMAFVGLVCCIRWPQTQIKKMRKWFTECQPLAPTVIGDKGDRKIDDSGGYQTMTTDITNEDDESNSDHYRMVGVLPTFAQETPESQPAHLHAAAESVSRNTRKLPADQQTAEETEKPSGNRIYLKDNALPELEDFLRTRESAEYLGSTVQVRSFLDDQASHYSRVDVVDGSLPSFDVSGFNYTLSGEVETPAHPSSEEPEASALIPMPDRILPPLLKSREQAGELISTQMDRFRGGEEGKGATPPCSSIQLDMDGGYPLCKLNPVLYDDENSCSF